MAFDFGNEVSDSSDLSPLSAVLLGQSGGGKSSLCDTFGVKTLYLYMMGEDHGVDNARMMGGDVESVCIDFAKNEQLDADAAIKRLSGILASVDDIKKRGYKAIAIDSATELCHLIRQTTEWRNACKTKDDKHNNFAENDATLATLRRLLLQLRRIQYVTGVHTAITCALDVRVTGEGGLIQEASPRLPGYSVAEGLIQMCRDVIVVGRVTGDDDITTHKLQFMVDVKKVARDDQKRVKKAINFSPRLQKFKTEELPETMDADLGEVIAAIKKKKRA